MGVLFQNDNISTLDSDSEFRLAVMAGAAQDEVRKLSGRLKFSFRQAIKKRPTCWAMTNCGAAAKAASLPSARRKPRWYNVSSTSMPISRRPSGAFWNAQNAEAHTVPIEAHLGVYSPYGLVLTGKFLLPLPPFQERTQRKERLSAPAADKPERRDLRSYAVQRGAMPQAGRVTSLAAPLK